MAQNSDSQFKFMEILIVILLSIPMIYEENIVVLNKQMITNAVVKLSYNFTNNYAQLVDISRFFAFLACYQLIDGLPAQLRSSTRRRN